MPLIGIKDGVKLHFLVIIWGFTAILGRLIEIPSVEIVFYRTMIASLGLWIVLVIGRKLRRISLREFVKIFFIGCLIGFHWITFFASARVSTISVCLAGMATTSLWTSLVEPIFLRRSIKVHEVVLGLFIIAGLSIIFSFSFEYATGLLLAVLSAFLAALFSVMNSTISSRYNHQFITFIEMIAACIITAAFFPFYTMFFSDGLQLTPSTQDWVYLLILGLICTVYAYSEYVELMKRMTAYAINLVINLEPVYGIILAVLIFGEEEKMNAEFYLGTAVILIAVFGYPFINSRLKKNPRVHKKML